MKLKWNEQKHTQCIVDESKNDTTEKYVVCHSYKYLLTHIYVSYTHNNFQSHLLTHIMMKDDDEKEDKTILSKKYTCNIRKVLAQMTQFILEWSNLL